jgi:O-antigen/teichoic acid export membrane protein
MFYKNTSIYVIGEVVPRLISFFTFPILTAYLSPADYGVNSFVSSISSFLFIFSNLSLSTYFFVEYFKTNSEKEKKILISTLSIFTNLYSLLIVVVTCLVGPYFLLIWGGNVGFYPFVFLGVLTMFFEVMAIYPSALYRVTENPLILVVFNLSKTGLIILGNLYVVFIKKGSLVDILLIQTIISGFTTVCFILYTRKFYSLVFDKSLIRGALKFSIPLFPASLSWYAYNTFDRVLIDKYLTLNDLGLFSTATTLALMLNIVSNSAYKAFEPLFFKNFGKIEFESIYNDIKKMYVFMILVGALYLSLFSREFFILFSSEEFFQSYLYVPYILIGTVISSIGLIYATLINANGNTKHNAVITVLGGVISILINVLFLRLMGIWAAILSSAMTYLFLLLSRMYFSKRFSFDWNATAAFLLCFAPSLMFNGLQLDMDLMDSILIKFIISLLSVYLMSFFLKIEVLNLIKKIMKTA